jgi:beta-lactamase superfamily II metal-dependent hydrolase
MFTIDLMPAAEGDCLWIEYGDAADPRRVLIDTGTRGTYKTLARRMKDLPEGQRRFELFVVSHIDSDHIGAAPHLLEKLPFDVEFGDVWFNGLRHLQPDRLGEAQAEIFSKALDKRSTNWNVAFEGRAVVVPEDGPLPVHTLDGDMKVTVLSPYRAQLEALRPGWQAYVDAAKAKAAALAETQAADRLGELLNVDTLAASAFDEDDKKPNGSSIALLLEFEGQAVALTADAHPGVLERTVDRLLEASGDRRLALDAFQVCHHGSARNTSPALAAKLDAASWLVSTSGVRHDHPHRESIARLLKQRPPLRDTRVLFNYRSAFNEVWDDPPLQRRHRFKAFYPEEGATGIRWPASE